jgi:hypothetical protein
MGKKVSKSLNNSEEKMRIYQATHGSPDHPLRIGDIEIPCYVLEDTRRVIVRSNMIAALDMKEGTASASTSGDRLVKFTSTKAVRKFVTPELENAIKIPIRFRTPSGVEAYGYEATVLADLCEAVLSARQQDKLNYQQEHIAAKCEILVRGFARVGIIALVDEATGFQDVRAREALEKILEEFISAELMKWVKTFPDDFYRELFRLRGLNYSQIMKRPRYFGHLTNDIVYKRLAPGVLEELQRITPKDNRGRREHKYFQRLTQDVGNPRLREHLSNVIVLMKASPNFKTFYRLLERSLPRYDHTPSLGLVLPEESNIDIFDDADTQQRKKATRLRKGNSRPKIVDPSPSLFDLSSEGQITSANE